MNFFVAALLAAGTLGASPVSSAADTDFATGNFLAALAAYSTRVAAAPNDVDALLGLGTIELYENDLAAAKMHLSRVVQLDPQNAIARGRLRTLEEREPNATDFRMGSSSPRVAIPFIATDPLPIVSAKIDGHAAVLLIDTGAPAIALTAQAAQRFGITLQAGGEGVFAGGKRAAVQRGRIDSVELGGVTVRGIPADALPGSLEIAGRAIDGAIGTSFLMHFLSTIDYARGQLILRPLSASSDFQRDAAGAGASIEPMWLVGDHFLFAMASVNDAASALFNIDTGGAGLGVQLTKASLESAGIAVDTSKAQDFTGGGGGARAIPFVAAKVALGETVERRVPGLYFPDGDQFRIFPFAVAGTISHEFFRRTAVTFDFTAMRIVVDASGRI
ncbi:MAG TPA: aspartyl protease family protein [Candidatus Tumulicola sp.]|jgi:predicted aspartyl protease